MGLTGPQGGERVLLTGSVRWDGAEGPCAREVVRGGDKRFLRGSGEEAEAEAEVMAAPFAYQGMALGGGRGGGRPEASAVSCGTADESCLDGGGRGGRGGRGGWDSGTVCMCRSHSAAGAPTRVEGV